MEAAQKAEVEKAPEAKQAAEEEPKGGQKKAESSK